MLKTQLLCGVYAIVNSAPSIERHTRALLDGGIRLVQYRAKHGCNHEELRALRELTRQREALLIVNDDWRAAMQYGADGVHLGPEDATHAQLAVIRKELHGYVLGISCGSVVEALHAQSLGADYLGVGSVFATTSKLDAGEPIGIDRLAQVASATDLPVAAIGGITAHNIAEVRKAGVAMAAVISALQASADPQSAARELVELWAGA